MKKASQSAALLIFCLGVPVALFEISRFLPRSTGSVPNLSYAETVTIVLAGLTISLGVLAVCVAGLAVWGYQSIKSEAVGAAERAATKAVEASVTKAVQEQIDLPAITKIVRREVGRLQQDAIRDALKYSRAFPAAAEQSERSADTGHVGKEYPKV